MKLQINRHAYTAQQAYGAKPLQKCIVTLSVAADWKESWEAETKGRLLRQLQGAPTRDFFFFFFGNTQRATKGPDYFGRSDANGQNRVKGISIRTEDPGGWTQGMRLMWRRRTDNSSPHVVDVRSRFRADTWRKEHAWNNITTKAMLTSSKYAKEIRHFTGTV